MKSKIPPIPSALLDYLDKIYPEQSANLQWTDREVWYKAGQRSVIHHLKRLFEEQNTTVIGSLD